MKIDYFSSTEAVMKELGRRVKSARIEMNITQGRMAEMSNLSKRTISNLENGCDVSLRTLVEVLRVLNRVQGMDSVIPESTVRPSQIASGEKPRMRASSLKTKAVSEKSWKWGDEQ